jgi:hypothetical protein
VQLFIRISPEQDLDSSMVVIDKRERAFVVGEGDPSLRSG